MDYYCKDCKNGITFEEYDYSLRKYGKPLCRVHQQSSSQITNSDGLSKKRIKCLSYQELKSGNKITPTSHNYLGNRKEFELDKEVIKDFCDFAVKFFSEI